MRSLRLLTAVAVAALPVALPLTSFAGTAAADAVTTPAWTPPLALDGGGAEPGIKVAPDGRSAAYITAPAGGGSNFWRVDESVDSAGITHLTPTSAVDPDLGTGGGDAEISVGTVDPANGCAPIAYSGLHNIDALDNFTTAYSTDCGKTFSLANPFATQNTLTDRQWQTFDGKLTNHLFYHKVDTGQIVDSVSYDGGRTYVTLGTPAGATGVVDTAHSFTLPNDKIGNVISDPTRPVAGMTYPVSGEQVHTLWATFEGSRDAQDAANGASGSGGWDHMDTVYVARSDNGGLTWTDVTSYTTGTTQTRELDLIFPIISEDSAGNLYSAWTDGNLIQYTVSTDAGLTWSKPYTVNPGETGAATANGTADIFPWIAGGGPGKLDVAWYHGQGGDTTGYRLVGSDTDPKDTTNWTVAFAQLSDATHTDTTGTAAPTVVQRDLAVSPVIHTGNVCNNGTTCGITDNGDRSLLDFFQVAIDSSGRANIAYAVGQGSPSTAHVEYIRQNSGQSLINGTPITPDSFSLATVATCAPAGVVSDPAGDATGAIIVGSTPMPNQADLDIVKGWFSTEHPAAGETITSHVQVTNLGTTGGEYFRFYFTYGGTAYLTVASRDVAGVISYDVESNGTTGASSLNLAGVTGSFDAANNVATVTFPVSAFNTTVKPAAPMADGEQFTGLQILAQRNTDVITATSDTATGTCPYVVGAAADPGADLPEAPAAFLLPIAGAAAAGLWLVRRRRTATV